MSLQQIIDAFKDWTKLPYAKMLAVALAIVCIVQESNRRTMHEESNAKDIVIAGLNKQLLQIQIECYTQQLKSEREKTDEAKQRIKEKDELNRELDSIIKSNNVFIKKIRTR